jgi:hypothetical protein
MLDLQIVPNIYIPKTNTLEKLKSTVEKEFEKYCKASLDEVEDYVIRIAGEIPYRDYKKYTAKVVRKNHIQTDEHWLTQKIITNELEKTF